MYRESDFKSLRDLHDFERLGQKYPNIACFTSFALKCLNFAKILENFAQSCNFTTSAFKSSDLNT